MATLSGIITPGNVLTATSTATLTNKTIAFGSNTLTDVASTNTAQTLTNKTFGSSTTVHTGTATQDGITLAGRAGGSTSLRVTIQPGTLTANRTLTLPDSTGTVLTTGAAVTVAQGGTGLTTLTANNVILGNGASNPTFVAPGTSGNVLTSNGSTWISAAPTVAVPDYRGVGAFGLFENRSNNTILAGATTAGSNLRGAGGNATGSGGQWSTPSNFTNPSGTWRLETGFGASGGADGTAHQTYGLYVRIS